MKVAQFSDSYKPITDGVANTVVNYTYWLNKKGHDSYAVAPSFPEYEDKEDYDVIRFLSIPIANRKPYRIGTPFIDIKAIMEVNTLELDLIHSHSPFTSGKFAYRNAKRMDIPLVSTFHSKYYDDFKQALKSEKLAEFAVRRVVDYYELCDHVWAVNNGTKSTLIDYGFKGDIEVMPNGTDFTTEHCDTKEVDKLIDFKENQWVFLFLGQNIWQKKVKMIIEAMRFLKDDKIDFKMIFIGDGYAKKEMEEMVDDLSLNENVVFMGKIFDRDLLRCFYHKSDLFVFPSNYDNAPIVVREAAACSLPSIMIKNSNAAEGVEDSYNGFLIDDSAKSLSNKIKEIIKDKEKLVEVGENAKSTIFQSWEDIIDKVCIRYEEIIRDYKKKQKKSIWK